MADTLRVDVFPAIQRIAGRSTLTVFPSAPWSGSAAAHSAVFPSRILAASGPAGPNPIPRQADSTLKTNMAKERERRTVPTDFNSCDSTNRVALQQAKRAARRFSIAVRAVELFSLLMHSPAFIV